MNSRNRSVPILIIAVINLTVSFILLFLFVFGVFNRVVEGRFMDDIVLLFLMNLLPSLALSYLGMHAYKAKPKSYRGILVGAGAIGVMGLFLGTAEKLIGGLTNELGDRLSWVGLFCVIMAIVQGVLLLRQDVKKELG
ncbi:MAG: hypothetical protein HQL17_07220 [Candidatus Omnitrophica bacterium]|nr:hypothetical protein [Candidatus Omnitrophota bacterium]